MSDSSDDSQKRKKRGTLDSHKGYVKRRINYVNLIHITTFPPKVALRRFEKAERYSFFDRSQRRRGASFFYESRRRYEAFFTALKTAFSGPVFRAVLFLRLSA